MATALVRRETGNLSREPELPRRSEQTATDKDMWAEMAADIFEPTHHIEYIFYATECVGASPGRKPTRTLNRSTHPDVTTRTPYIKRAVATTGFRIDIEHLADARRYAWLYVYITCRRLRPSHVLRNEATLDRRVGLMAHAH